MVRPIALALALLIGAPATAAEAVAVKVLSCYDGDTCLLEREILPGRDRVRLANADTPEMEGQCQEEIRQAMMARDYTRSLVVGRVVTLTAVEPDKYDKRFTNMSAVQPTAVAQPRTSLRLRCVRFGHRSNSSTRTKSATYKMSRCAGSNRHRPESVQGLA